jgi:hypothetical protein
MTDEKLKTAVREAWIECGWTHPDSTLDKLVNALSRRGVVVQGDGDELARLRAIEAAARNVADTLNGGFVLCENCGEQESTTDMDYARELYAALELPPQTPPAPVFVAGKRYLSRCGEVWIVTGPSGVEGYEFRAKRAEGDVGPFSFAKNGAFWSNGRTHPNDLIPGAIPDEPLPVFEEEPPADGSNWRSTRQEAPALTPLTYEQACALPVGSEIVCLDAGEWGNKECPLLAKGKVYIIEESFNHRRKERNIKSETGNWFTLNEKDCHLFSAVPPASAEGEKSSPVITDQLAEVNTNAAGESPAPAVTDEEIGREMVRIYNDASYFGRGTAKAHYAQMGRRARELLQPCNGALQVSADGKTVAPICDLKVRLEKAEAALERVRATFEGWLRPAATSEGGKHVDTILWEVAREAGLRIIPAEPAKPLRVEVAK